ncbi:MAG TPA: hypothetical protein VFU40_06275 [Gemmatimonadales bacterium]|nr:hypothetical protein [Gemmatimonadales bacterium]
MALTLALSVLAALTVPMLALLSVSALEPLMTRNLVDMTRAFYLAEAGIEWALTLPIEMLAGNTTVPGTTGSPAGAQSPAGAPEYGSTANLAPPAGLLPWGTTAISVRRGAGILEDGTSLATPDVIVLTSTGTVNGAQRIIEVTVRPISTRAPAGSGGPGPVSKPGIVSWREW